MNGADLVARWLTSAGVEVVFSLSGNQILGLYDALDRAGVRIVHTRHEAGAVHMADAYARLTGQIGICLVTAGPGHTNALGALAMAEAAEAPVLLLSGHAPFDRAGQGAFQEMDQVGLARPITRWSDVARRAGDIPALLSAAVEASRAAVPGPVHLSLPVDVLAAGAEFPIGDVAGGSVSRTPAARGASLPAATQSALAETVAALHSAHRPLILAGPSAARPALHAKLTAFAERTRIPLLILDHPRGLSDLALGQAGKAVPRADAILLFGKRLDYRLGYGSPPAIATDARLFHVDPAVVADPSQRAVEIRVTAPLATAAVELEQAAGDLAWPGEWAGWAREVEQLRKASTYDLAPPPGDGTLHPLRVFDALANVLAKWGERNACIVLDGGEFGQWARARLRLQPPHHLLNEPSGAIGFALPFAIGAKAAHPERLAVAVCGDGAFGFTAMELETAARCRLPVLVLVGVDGAWGTERHLQASRHGRTVATDLLPARYDLLATGLGCHGEHVATLGDLAPALSRAVAAVGAGQPAVLSIDIQSVPSPAGAPP